MISMFMIVVLMFNIQDSTAVNPSYTNLRPNIHDDFLIHSKMQEYYPLGIETAKLSLISSILHGSQCVMTVYDMKTNQANYIMPMRVEIDNAEIDPVNPVVMILLDVPNMPQVMFEFDHPPSHEVVFGGRYAQLSALMETYPDWQFFIFYAQDCTHRQANSIMNMYFGCRFNLPPCPELFHLYFVGMGEKYRVNEDILQAMSIHNGRIFQDGQGNYHRYFYDREILEFIRDVNPAQYSIDLQFQENAAIALDFMCD